jgi:hypothetical protein
MEQLGSHWTDFHEILYLNIFRKSLQKIQVSLKSGKNNGYFTWRPVHVFYHVSLSFSQNTKSLSFSQNTKCLNKSCRDNQNTLFMFSNFLPPENRAMYEIMWKNTVQPDRLQMTIWRERIACWIAKTTNTQSEYVVIIAFLLQQRLQERASVLRCTYTACLVNNNLVLKKSVSGFRPPLY